MPKSNAGKWSLVLIILMPILFVIGPFLTDAMYESVAAGGTILEDISARPVLAFSMLGGMACGIASFVTGLLAIIKNKDRSLWVYASTVLGAGLILVLIAVFVSPN